MTLVQMGGLKRTYKFEASLPVLHTPHCSLYPHLISPLLLVVTPVFDGKASHPFFFKQNIGFNKWVGVSENGVESQMAIEKIKEGHELIIQFGGTSRNDPK